MAKKENPIGYHLKPIPKGEVGELSKIYEELLEAMDAKKQKCEIMVLIELSDMLGAVEMYLKKHHPSITLDDLKTMSAITARAFENGHRLDHSQTTKVKSVSVSKATPQAKEKSKSVGPSQGPTSLPDQVNHHE